MPSIQRCVPNFSVTEMNTGDTPVVEHCVEVARFISENKAFLDCSYSVSPPNKSHIRIKNLFSVCEAKNRQPSSCWNDDLIVLDEHRTRNADQVDFGLVFPNHCAIFRRMSCNFPIRPSHDEKILPRTTISRTLLCMEKWRHIVLKRGLGCVSPMLVSRLDIKGNNHWSCIARPKTGGANINAVVNNEWFGSDVSIFKLMRP